MIKSCMIRIFCCIAFLVCHKNIAAQNNCTLQLKFCVSANKKPITLGDSSYQNAFGEIYQLTRLKYYLSNVNTGGTPRRKHNSNVFLLEAGTADSLEINISPGTYTKLNFTLGVDSALNNSGAQDGELDPLHGMFWTWNSGYIFFKLEGYSSASKADLNRIEHHVGGYRFPNNAARHVELQLPYPLQVAAGDKRVIELMVNLDDYWKGKNEIKIADQALLMTPGGLAIAAADNLQSVFSIKSMQ